MFVFFLLDDLTKIITIIVNPVREIKIITIIVNLVRKMKLMRIIVKRHQEDVRSEDGESQLSLLSI